MKANLPSSTGKYDRKAFVATAPPSKAKWLGKFSRRTLIVLGCIIVALVLIRLALPFAVKKYVNHQLNQNTEYGGSIGTVYLSLWRGAYTIKQIDIYKRSGAIHEPFFNSSNLDLSIEWKELFHGAVVGAVEMDEPRLNFVSGPTAQQTQTGKDVAWDQTLSSLFPFKINRFQIKEGEVHFRNHYSTPPVDIYLNNLDAVATNLSNSRELSNKLPAGLKAHATTLGRGDLDLQLHLNPSTPKPTYEMVCQLSNVDLVSLNDFLRAYGKFDVDRGQFALFASVASKDGNYEGYIKTFFDNLDVFKWQKEKRKGALQIVWDGVVQSAAFVFKNHPNNSLATRIPISGTYDKNEVGVWATIGNLLRNAFVHALVPKVDEKVTINKVEADKSTNAPPPIKPIKPTK